MNATITHSQRTMAKTCLRKHWFRYVAGIRRVETARALSVGRAIHAGWEHGNVLAGIEAYDAAMPEAPDMEWYLDREIVGQLLTAYFEVWAHDPIEYVAHELQFDLPTINPQTGRPSTIYRSGGKIDGIGRLVDTRLAVVEGKTTSSDIAPESDYWKRLRIDSQISTYVNAARALGYDVRTVVYDVIRKPEIEPRMLTQANTAAFVLNERYCGQSFTVDRGEQGSVIVSGIVADMVVGKQGYAIRETVPMYGARLAQELRADWRRYFARREIGRTSNDIVDARKDDWDSMKLIHECARNDRWPRNTSQCIVFKPCPYFKLCTESFDPAQTLPEGFEFAEPHEELLEEGTP